MFDKLIDIVRKDEKNWTKFQQAFIEKEIASKTVLLHEGEIASNIYFIKKGCLREWFNKDGKNINRVI
jgi:CRP-like cAMP-binding protein